VTIERLTAVIVNYGTPDLTLRAARALLDDGLPPDRLVVVDNGSLDDSHERLTGGLEGCLVLRLEENVGFARGANVGAAALTGDAYLIVNNDAFVHVPGSVEKLCSRLDNPSIGVVAPRLLNEDLTLQGNVVPVSTPAVALMRASGLSRFVPNRFQPRWSTHWDHATSREIQAADGAVLLVRGDAWRELDGYVEAEHMYAEDLDLCWRAREAGWKVWFESGAEFVHLGGGSTRNHWGDPERARRVGYAEATMIGRHLGPVSSRATLAFISLGVAARWLFYAATRKRAAAATYRGSLQGYLHSGGKGSRPRAPGA
jgi:N-acetylglucosaminyl-diphospho-decaprenol L-rhamnosyltransferase